jgi:hypothetical protein
MADFNSEWTPQQFWGERQEPNVIEWFRLEQWGKGASTRLFYNEVAEPNWLRHNGHLDNPEEVVYSFTNANQDQNIVFGIDTTTEEGRLQYKAEYEALNQLAPEIIKMEDFQFPHEMGKQISSEPHFQRIWKYYRDHSLKNAIDGAAADGKCALEDANTAKKFIGTKHNISLAAYCYTKQGLRPDLENDEAFLATDRVMKAIGMQEIPITILTAESFEDQFWSNFDGQNGLTELQMREELPFFITDPSNRMKVEALMDGRTDAALEQEETQQLTA